MIGKETLFTQICGIYLDPKGRTNDEGFADHIDPGYYRKHHDEPVIECDFP